MTGSLDREKGLLYDASIHLRFGEGDMDQTGQNIIDAAMELVVERGYTATTTKDIAKRAGVNECTIFRKLCFRPWDRKDGIRIWNRMIL